MKELLKRILIINMHRNNKETEVAPQPSPFVLKQDNRERRLNIDEEIPLDPGPCDLKDNKITSLIVSPRLAYLILHTECGPMYRQNGEWGYVDTRHYHDKTKKENKESWTNSYTKSAINQQDGKNYLNGSNVYLDDETKCLHGPGWILEYSPLESNS